MFQLSHIYKVLLFFILVVMAGKPAIAADEPYQRSLTGKIRQGDTLVLQDEKFRNPAYNWSLIQNLSVDNSITFALNRNGVALPNKNFRAKVDLKVEYWSQPGQDEPMIDDHVVLEITYDTARLTVYQGEAMHYFKNGHRVKITVNSISSEELGEDMPDIFQLVSRVAVDRKYIPDPNKPNRPDVQTVFLTPSGNENEGTSTGGVMRAMVTGDVGDEGAGEMLVRWNLGTFELFDVDWTFVEAESAMGVKMTSGVTITDDEIHQYFRNNFTRVTVGTNEYKVSLVQQAKYMIVRVRGVNLDAEGNRVEEDWGKVAFEALTNTWHEPNKNWQYNATYVEEGKKKEVVTYADGSLRSRQTVTVANPGSSVTDPDKFAIVQETLYDQFGRAAVQILPAPLRNKSLLKYYPGLHLNSSGQPYNFRNFYGADLACNFAPEAMYAPAATPGLGAAGYYSASNEFLDLNPNFKAIPRAEGFPFSVTRFMPDNTGRISEQGGVGPMFQPGAKSTKYYYGKPNQWELDRIFGNDVGYASHYMKKMVVDPNGQVSVSYENAAGKVIATALAGEAPPNLDGLPGKPAAHNVQQVILEPAQFRFDPARMMMYGTTNYMSTTLNQELEIRYDVEQLMEKYQSAGVQICSNCYYTLKATITDDCGDVKSVSTDVIGAKLSDCNITGVKTGTIPYTAEKVGVYYIRFELSLSEDVIGAYTDDFIRRNTDLESQFDFILRELQRLNFNDCLADCQTCASTIGEKAAFKNRISQQLALQGVDVGLFATRIDSWAGGLYDALSAHCQVLESTCSEYPCEEYRVAMLADVSPGGQYALFGPDQIPLEKELNVLYMYRLLAFPQGDPDASKERFEVDGRIVSPFDADFTLDMLVRYWKPEWAERFLQFHPEYCKLQWCELNSGYVRWDTKLQQEIINASQISRLQSGLQYQATVADWLLEADPYFASGAPGADQQAAFRNKLLNYTQTLFTGTPVKGLSQYVDYILYCSNTGSGTNVGSDSWTNCTPETVCRVPDREWTLYKQKYLELKEEFYKLKRDAACAGKCTPGQPVTLGAISCPGPGMFRLAEVSSNASVRTFNVRFEGMSTGISLVKMYLQYISGGITNQLVLDYTPGSTQTWSVPVDVSIGQITIMRTECVNGTVSTPACDGPSLLLELTANGKQVHQFEFSDATGGTVKRYYLEKGYSNELPDLQQYCQDATSTFYNCLKIKVSGKSGEYNYQNVWLITCNVPQGLMSAHVLTGSESGNPVIPTAAAAATPENCGVTEADFSAHLQWIDGNESYRVNLSSFATIPPGKIVYVTAIAYFDDWTAEGTFAVTSENPPSGFYEGNINGAPGNVSDNSVNDWDFFFQCEDAPCSPLLINKKPRFPQISITAPGNDVDKMTGEALAAIKQQVIQTCNDNAESWVLAIEDCIRANTTTTTDFNTKRAAIKAGFAAVCALGGDVDHPFGSSTTMPGKQTPQGYKSFGDVIKGVLGIPAYTMACNPWLINGPAPYNTKVQATRPMVSATNPQICKKLADLKALHAGSGDFHTWLVNRFGADAAGTAEQTAMLEEACGNCKFLLKKDFQLPVYLEPGTTGCVERSAYTTAKADFNSLISGGPQTTDPNYGLMLATFLNQRWGFTMGYEEYAAYEATATAEPNMRLCNQPAFSNTVKDDPLSCIMSLVNDAVNQGNFLYAQYIREQRRLFRERYINKCAATRATVQMNAPEQIYHYTLYYYNQAGQLIRTVPPEGVRVLSDADVLAVKEAREQKPPANCSYAGPVVEGLKSQVNASLQSLVTNGGALEYWLQQSGTSPVSAIHTTDGATRYLITTCLNGTILRLDVYRLKPGTNNTLVDIDASRHTAVDISGANAGASPWRHVLIQGASLFANDLTVYVNGVRCPNVTASASGGCVWEMGFNNGTVMYPENYTAIRHMRVYTTMRTDNQALLLSQNTCLNAGGSEEANRNAWYAFGVNNGSAPLPEGSLKDLKYPGHKMRTSYAYNTLGQVVKQYSPDAKDSEFWYDYLGRLVVSQNAEQRAPKDAAPARRSYTLYDPLGRITEVGSVSGGAAIDYSKPFLTQTDVSAVVGGARKEITKTYYDVKPDGLDLTLTNLRKRVSASSYSENSASEDQITYYSYDAMGNVKSLWQKLKDLDNRKQIEYDYDLASGKVNSVRYQGTTASDRFMYKYSYDAENRLTKVEAGSRFTGSTGWKLDIGNKKDQAAYYYYPHGPLARMELGTGVQGVDYAYTLTGWLKGVNSQFLDPANDLGGDAIGDRSTFAKDVFSYSLSYFPNDYKPVNGAFTAFNLNFAGASDHGKPLYNGNIAAMTVGLDKFTTGKHVGYAYGYDQLNRMKRMRQQLPTTSSWVPRTGDQPYSEDVVYDGNGNIKFYDRKGVGSGQMSLAMDNLSYVYENGADGPTNKLVQVQDLANEIGYANDIKGTHTYDYDKIGNLTEENWGSKRQKVTWNTYGKIASIETFDGALIKYLYDAGGNRVYKSYKTSSEENFTWYIRDPQGNMLATYTKKGTEALKWTEQALYGSSRLGLWTPGLDMSASSPGDHWLNANNKQYELTNHLGNVLAVINDSKVVVSQQDYYPFGSPMPGRYGLDGSGNQAIDVVGSKYKYGFNGKENDNEVKGEGNQQDYGMRIYDPRIAKFLSVDPITAQYPELTPYQFASNTPIAALDLDGLEGVLSTGGPLGINIKEHLTWEDYKAIGRGLERTAKALAPIRFADDDEPQTIGEWWESVKNIPSGLKQLPSHLADVYSKGTREQKIEESVALIGTAFSLAKGKVSATKSTISSATMIKGGLQLTRSSTVLSRAVLNVVRFTATFGVNNGLRGITAYDDLMAAGMEFVGRTAKKVYANSGRFIGWESADGLKRFRPPVYKAVLSKVQANFEQRTAKSVSWDNASDAGRRSNVHVDSDKIYNYHNERLNTSQQ